MADKYLIGAPVQGQNKPTPLREGDNILNAHLLVGEAGQVAPNIYIVRDEKYVRYDTLTEAKNDAVAGETIVVARGTYNEQDLLKDQVNWHFEEGVKLFNDTDTPIFTDENTGQVTCTITGKVDVEITQGPSADMLSPGVLFGVSDSKIKLEWSKLEVDEELIRIPVILNKGEFELSSKTNPGIYIVGPTYLEGTSVPEVVLSCKVEDEPLRSGQIVQVLEGHAEIKLSAKGRCSLAGVSGAAQGSLEVIDSTISQDSEDGYILQVASEEFEVVINSSRIMGRLQIASNLELNNSTLSYSIFNSLNVPLINKVGNKEEIIVSPNGSIIQGAIDPRITLTTNFIEPIQHNLTENDFIEITGNYGRKYFPAVNLPTDHLNPRTIRGIYHRVFNRGNASDLIDAYNDLPDPSSTMRFITLFIAPMVVKSNIEFDRNGPYPDHGYNITISSFNGEPSIFIDKTLTVSGNNNTLIGFHFVGSLIITGNNVKIQNCSSSSTNFTDVAEYHNCVGGVGSFSGVENGAKLYNCRLTFGEFPEPANGGFLINCIDGNGNLITSFSDD